jgi:hypothetical protein
MLFTLQINLPSIPRIALAVSLFLLGNGVNEPWAQTPLAKNGQDQGQKQPDSSSSSPTKPRQPQSIGLESILEPGWAGREQAKPISSNLRQPPITLTPGQYATSVALSLGATLVPAAFASILLTHDGAEMSGVGLIAASLIIGPSTGQFVYGFSGHGYLAAMVRLSAIAATFSVLGASFGSCEYTPFSDNEEDCSNGFDPTYGLVATGALYLGGFLYSLIQPAFAIHREPARTVLPIEVLPRLSYDAQGHSTLGLAAGWRF